VHATALERVSAVYQMQAVTSTVLQTSVMLKCWESDPLNRPTVVHLLGFFDDSATESEEHYSPPDDDQDNSLQNCKTETVATNSKTKTVTFENKTVVKWI